MTLRTTTRRAGLAILLVAAGTSLAACGSSSKSSAKAPTTKIEGVNVAYATDLSRKPLIDIPDVLPPTTLIKKDIVVGKGAVVKSTDTLTAAYVGVAWSTNKQFDASWDRAEKTIPFGLASGVIKGWTQGLPGMRIGGRRLLIVPPALGYGDQGQGDSIPAGETLVFIVDAKKAEKTPAATSTASTAGSGSQLSQEQLQQALAQAQASGGTSSAAGTAAP